MVEVQQYAVCDFELSADLGDKNPFAVEVTATFTHELGEVVENLPGFFDGDKWVVRFSPGIEGVWAGRSRSENMWSAVFVWRWQEMRIWCICPRAAIHV